MPPHRRVDSEPNSPKGTEGALADILNLSQQLTPSKSPRRLRQLRAEIQARANDAEEADSAKNLQIADLTNQALPIKPARKRRKRFNRADDADDSIPNPVTLEERVREAGRHFVVVEALFLVDARLIWTVELKEDFDFAFEFQSKANKVQGQLHDVIALLPSDAVSLRTEPWIAGAFEDGMSGQRSTISNRLRHASLQVLMGANQLKHFRSSNSRFDAFAALIGYKPATDATAAHYSAFDAEILYDNYDGTINVDKIFRHPLLLKIYACILRGPYGTEGLFEGEYHLPQASCVQQIYNVTCTSTGAVSTCATLAIWMLSADTKLTERGDQTGISYRPRHATYAQRLHDGIRNNKAWAVDLLKYWDSILFPNNDDSADASGAPGGEDDEMDLVDEAFDGAPSVDAAPEQTNDPALQVQSPRANEEHDDGSERDDSCSPPPPAQSGSSHTGHEHHAEEQFPGEKKQAAKRRR
ncbi:hypothetical protein DFH08DRAFT_1081173 [Mycena albidolilacea]|uniref:Uncharacterized protein n=1 Tax=Mycena albidolilacea TaxID=1033008 RepID=A0AAD7A0B1_9AGAR|nr:hypothetical protein DFH08DRAFT_1081173 [Mycena albidolilacea]